MSDFQFICLYLGMGIMLVLMCCHPACRIEEPGEKSEG
jgi:hypothetical protein